MILDDKTIRDFWRSLKNLHFQLQIFDSGDEGYRGYVENYIYIAIELRKLICDSGKKKNNGLLLRFEKPLILHPITGGNRRLKRQPGVEILFAMPQCFCPSAEGSNKLDIIEKDTKPIPLDTWLNQFVYATGKQEHTVHDIIRGVADKEGAHADVAMGAVISDGGPRIGSDGIYAYYIASMGKYILERMWGIASNRVNVLQQESERLAKQQQFKSSHKYIDEAIKFLSLYPHMVPLNLYILIKDCRKLKANIYRLAGDSDGEKKELESIKKMES